EPEEAVANAVALEQRRPDIVEERLRGRKRGGIARVKRAEKRDRRVDADTVDLRDRRDRVPGGRGGVGASQVEGPWDGGAVSHRRAAQPIEPFVVRVTAKDPKILSSDRRRSGDLGEYDVVWVANRGQHELGRNPNFTRHAVHAERADEHEFVHGPDHTGGAK